MFQSLVKLEYSFELHYLFFSDILVQLALDIETETKESNRYLNGMVSVELFIELINKFSTVDF